MSLVAGAVLAPLIWVLVSAGQGAFQSGQTAEGAPSDLTTGGLILVGIGLLAGLIATLRTSPLGAVLVGLVFVGASAWLYIDQEGALSTFTTSWELQGLTINLATPLTSGLLAFAGGLLLMSTFSAERWHSDDDAEEEEWTPIPQETEDYWSYR